MRGKEAIVKLLEQAGVEVVFGLCGDTSLPYYEAFYDLKPNIKHVLTRDERSAGYMADAYARLSGRVGVCEGPSGGGATYIIPGVAEANQSSIPLVCLTSDIDSRQRWRGTLTEIDQDALFEPITVWTKTPTDGIELARAFRDAFQRSTTGSLGPTHIGLPLNVQEAEIPDEEVHIDSRYSRYPACRVAPDIEAIKNAAQAIVNSRSPVIVAGAGVIRSEAWQELKSLVDLVKCPVATSISGKGAIADTDPYALGVIGSNAGLPYRHDLVNQADLIFYIGCSCGSVTTNKWTVPVNRDTTIIQMDINPAVIGLNYEVAHVIVSDAKMGLNAMIQALTDLLGGKTADKMDPQEISRLHKNYMAGIEEFQSDATPIRPERFMTELSAVMPENGIIITDPGTPTPYVSAYYRFPRAGRWFVTNRAHGALGYSLPASVGACFARPNDKVVAIMGDGSFGFTSGELETISRLQVPVVLIVMANSIYGWIKAGQRVMGGKYFSVDFSATDHCKIAQACGLDAQRVEHPGDLKAALQRALNFDGPTLLDVVVQPLHEAKAPVSKWVA
jgi:acetolactate synthase-1/2/3 large subunit